MGTEREQQRGEKYEIRSALFKLNRKLGEGARNIEF
jgi:hypothetical protein